MNTAMIVTPNLLAYKYIPMLSNLYTYNVLQTPFGVDVVLFKYIDVFKCNPRRRNSERGWYYTARLTDKA